MNPKVELYHTDADRKNIPRIQIADKYHLKFHEKGKDKDPRMKKINFLN